MQALAEALTTTKGMLGRRLLQCSDLSTRICAPWPISKCHNTGFAHECNSIVNAFKATWDKARKAAVDGVTKLANEAEQLANVAAAAATKKFNEF